MLQDILAKFMFGWFCFLDMVLKCLSEFNSYENGWEFPLILGEWVDASRDNMCFPFDSEHQKTSYQIKNAIQSDFSIHTRNTNY